MASLLQDQHQPLGEASPLLMNNSNSRDDNDCKERFYSYPAPASTATLCSDEAVSIIDDEQPGLLLSTCGSMTTESSPQNVVLREKPGDRFVAFQEHNNQVSANEESPLLLKTSSSSNALLSYSQRTARTVGTSGSDEPLPGEQYEEMEVLGSVLVFKSDEQQQKENNALPPSEPLEKPEAAVDASLIENVVDEVYEVAEAILEELHDADEGDAHFLEIGLTRNFSILPGDIADAAQEQPPPSKPPPEDDSSFGDIEAGLASPNNAETKTSKTPVSAYILLLCAVVALSSIGPLLQLQHDASGTLKVVWRMAGTSVFLFPFAAVDLYHHGVPKLTFPQWVTFFISTVCYGVLCVGFVLALDFTAVGNAVILSNSLALILLIGKLCVGDPVSFLEGSGAIIAFTGAALCSRDSAEAHSSTIAGSGYIGDALAILSALGGVGYLICAKTTRAHIPLYLFMFLTMFVGGILILMFEILVLGETVTFDQHPTHGLWGWLLLESDRLPLEIFIVIVCNGLGTMGYVRAMQYFDNLVISSAALAEPVVAELMAFAFGVGSLPGLQGWLGNLLVAVGTFAVIFEDGSRNKDGKSLH